MSVCIFYLQNYSIDVDEICCGRLVLEVMNFVSLHVGPVEL
jgi:hypothetical protein